MSEHQLTIILGRIKKILINVSNNFVTSFYSSNFNALNVLQKVSKEIVTMRHQPPPYPTMMSLFWQLLKV